MRERESERERERRREAQRRAERRRRVEGVRASAVAREHALWEARRGNVFRTIPPEAELRVRIKTFLVSCR